MGYIWGYKGDIWGIYGDMRAYMGDLCGKHPISQI